MKAVAAMAAGIAAVVLSHASALATSHNSHGHHPPGTASTAANELVEGEVRRIDKAAGKVTLRHGAIKSLDMPAMTMVFQVKDRALLDQVREGDKVRFRAVNEDGSFVVTELAPVK